MNQKRWNTMKIKTIAAVLTSVLLISKAGAQTGSPPPGTLVSWGGIVLPHFPPGTRFAKISAGGSHNLTVESDGTVAAWGDNFAGAITVPAALNDVVAISTGEEHSLALKNDGTVVAWGANDNGQTNIPVGLSGVVAIAAGGFHSLALKSDGTVVGWGNNYYGQATAPAGLNEVVGIAAGGDYSLALKSDGTIVAWGENYFGQTSLPAGLDGMSAWPGRICRSMPSNCPLP